MYNKHTLTKQDVREVLEVLSQFENEHILAEGKLTNLADKVRNAANDFLNTVKDKTAKSTFLNDLKVIAKLGTPSKVVADFIDVVKAYDGDIKDLLADSKKLIDAKKKKGVSEVTTQSGEVSEKMRALEKFQRTYGIVQIWVMMVLGSLVGNNALPIKQLLDSDEQAKVVNVDMSGTPTTDQKAFDHMDQNTFMKYLNGKGVKAGGEKSNAGGSPDLGTFKKALDSQNVDVSDGEPDENTEVVHFDKGEYKLTSAVKASLVKKIVNNILGKAKQIKAKGGNPGTVVLKTDGHITYDQGDPDNSNTANDGSKDLVQKRTATAGDIASDVEKELKKQAPNLKVTTKKGTGDNWKTQKQVPDNDKTKDVRSATVGFGVEGQEIIGLPVFLTKGGEPNRIGGEPEGEPTGEEPRGGDEQPRTGEPEVGTDKILAQARGSNRLGQYGAIFKVLSNDKADIFQALGKKPGETITDRELETLRNKKEGEASTLAQVILNSRKNPNTFLKKFAAAMGGKIDVEKRQRAYMAGAGEKGRSASGLNQGTVTELLREEFENMLTEAGVDQFLANASSLPKEVKLKVLALLADMYIQDNPEETISLVDPKEFGFTAQEITDAGFAFEPTSKKYIKLARGEKKPTKGTVQQLTTYDKTQSSTATAPDVDRVAKSIDNKQTLEQYFDTINRKEEVTQLVLGLLNMYDTTKLNKQNLDTALTTALSRLNEEVSADVQKLLGFIQKDLQITSNLSRIDTIEEAIQTILRVALVFINDEFRRNKPQLKQAIQDAITQFRKQAPTSKSSQSANKTGFTSTSTAPGIDIDNIKYVQEAKRWQKLAGIIK